MKTFLTAFAVLGGGYYLFLMNEIRKDPGKMGQPSSVTKEQVDTWLRTL